jgi:hypothetical protein
VSTYNALERSWELSCFGENSTNGRYIPYKGTNTITGKYREGKLNRILKKDFNYFPPGSRFKAQSVRIHFTNLLKLAGCLGYEVKQSQATRHTFGGSQMYNIMEIMKKHIHRDIADRGNKVINTLLVLLVLRVLRSSKHYLKIIHFKGAIYARNDRKTYKPQYDPAKTEEIVL